MSSLSDIAMGAGRANATTGRAVVDIIEFIEAPWGLGMRLFPVQKVILKIHYGLELDDKVADIVVTDFRKENPRYYTEAGYLRMLHDEKRCNVREVIPGIERREMVLSIGRRSGKCVTGDTLICTNQGMRRMDSLGSGLGPEVQHLCVTVAQEGQVRAQSAYFYNGGVRGTVRVQTSSGYHIEGTSNHRIKVMSISGVIEWRALGDIGIHDVVCIHRGTNLWSDETTLTKEQAYSLGLDIPAARLIPDVVLQSTRDVVCSFVCGVFNRVLNARVSRLHLRLQNKTTASELQLLLLNLGIVSCVTGLDLDIRESRSIQTLLQCVGISDHANTPPRYADLPHQNAWTCKLLGLDKEAIDHFQHLHDVDYYYDPVSQVSHGSAHVFDLNVPDGESFVANGLTNHNTTISACISAYETYTLISKGDPQGYYGLPASNNIQLISVATDKDQAGLLYNEVSGHFGKCGFFKPYMANNTQSYARFQSPKDIASFGSYSNDPGAKATLKITFRSCIAKGLRGAGNIVVILDEVAHFTDGGQSSAETVYNAVTPSTSAFSAKDPLDGRIPIGPVEGRIISISSPLGKQGLFYKLFNLGMTSPKAAQNMMCIQAPTWEVNPTVPASEFEKHYAKDPRVFNTEYGAEFSDRTKGWIENSNDLFACIEPTARPRVKAPPRMPHLAGIDLALVGDYSTIAIGHPDANGRIVADIVDGIRAGEGDFASYDRLEFSDVADWIYDYSRRFYISEGIFDQHLGIAMEQALISKGLGQFHAHKFSQQQSSQMFQNFKDMMYDKRLVLYDWPIPDGDEHCRYITELMELQAEIKNKYITIVEKPKTEGKHDDHADALVRMVWLASQNLTSGNSLGNMNRGGFGVGRSMSPVQATQALVVARKKALQSGSVEQRQIMKQPAHSTRNPLLPIGYARDVVSPWHPKKPKK